MIQNQMNMMGNNYPQNNAVSQGAKPASNLPMGFMIFLIIMAVGCFLPFMKVGDLVSTNYISFEENMKDGVFLIGLGIVAFVLALKGKYLVPLILQGISTVIFIIDAVDAVDAMGKYNELYSNLGDTFKMQFGIGFYIVLVGVAGSLICIFKLWKDNKGVKQQLNYGQPQQPNYPQQGYQQPMQGYTQQPVPQPMMNPQPQYQQPTQTSCPYYGTAKDPNTTFCSNCGAKF